MQNIVISTKKIIIIPLIFFILLVVKVSIDYYESTHRMHSFIEKQAQNLNIFMLTHRNYYQSLYLNETIKLDEKTVLGLPAFSAFEISKQFSEKNNVGTSIQTVSDRARNPKNQAAPSEMKAIDFFNKNKNEKEYFSDEDTFFQYASPLYIEQKCLTCHGKKEEAPKFISEKYGTAYDYKLGELRGIVSIKVPKEKLKVFFTYALIREVLFDTLILAIIFFITRYLVLYFRNLSQNLEQEVKYKTKELTKNLASLHSYQLAMDESSIVSKTDLSGRITYVNDNFCKISGFTREVFIGKTHSLIKHPNTNDEIFKDLWKTIQNKQVWKGVIQNRGKETDYWVDICIVPILDEYKNMVEFVAIRHDVTQMVEQQEKLSDIANTDTLTGYGNRYKLGNTIANSTCPALAILNIDNFSQVNDFYGHETGDEVIKKLGYELATILQTQNCELYHLQGDEYVIFNNNISRELFINQIIFLTKQISQTSLMLGDEELLINFTVAISFEGKEAILKTADMALKIAKKENKSMLIYTDEISLNNEYENNIKWTKKLKYAFENDKIVPVFQPIVNNSNGKWEKYEALVRLKDSDGKLISPYFFLDISKKTKHYLEITRTMIQKSFDTFQDKDSEFSINLTVEDILNTEIKLYIFKMLEQYQIGNRVVFEIVESESIEKFQEVLEFIEDVKKYGCKIAIDDFGTGYSNFEYLLKLKVDYIKIDGSMIKHIDTDTDAKLVVSTIVDFTKKMNIKTIAEFVENESIFQVVQELGIDYSQGYYFLPPQEKI